MEGGLSSGRLELNAERQLVVFFDDTDKAFSNRERFLPLQFIGPTEPISLDRVQNPICPAILLRTSMDPVPTGREPLMISLLF